MRWKRGGKIGVQILSIWRVNCNLPLLAYPTDMWFK